MRIYIGCGGYSNKDWKESGLLYEGIKPNEYLKVYARHFDAVELNSSFYAMPSPQRFTTMQANSGSLVFTIKLGRVWTHERNPSAQDRVQALSHPQILRDHQQFGGYIAQFPYSFQRTPQNRLYLADLVAQFAQQPLAIEFRHHSWDQEIVREQFKKAGLTWVVADYPELEGLPVAQLHQTISTVYIRLHGKNKENWWDANSAAQRHDYFYSWEELNKWAQEIAQLKNVEKVFIFFENTTKGHALDNIKTLRKCLQDQGLSIWMPSQVTMQRL